MSLSDKLAGLSGVHRSIAADVWPHGAILGCRNCGYSERITSEQAGAYLRQGWPKHCGATMTCDQAAAVSEIPAVSPDTPARESKEQE